MQLVADPAHPVALGVTLAADVAGPRQIRQHRVQAHAQLPFEPPGERVRTRLAVAGAAPPGRGLGRLRRRRGSDGLLPRFDGRAVAADVPDQAVVIGGCDQGLVQARWQGTGGEFGEGSGEGPRLRNFPGTAPAAQPTQPLVQGEPFDQQIRRRQLEDRLGDEGAGQGRPIRRWPSRRTVRIGQELLDAHELQNRHQFPVPFRQRADLFFKIWEEFRLDPPPCVE
jgi:hypothetical protein